MAAGNDLEVYWRVYTQHNRGHVQEHMKPYKIGELSPADMATVTERSYYDDSAYAANPEPYPDLVLYLKMLRKFYTSLRLISLKETIKNFTLTSPTSLTNCTVGQHEVPLQRRIPS